MIIAGTGHRPPKLGGYSDEVFYHLVELATISLKQYKPDKVISGMALGWDQALAQAALDLKIPLIAAIPFPGQHLKWPKSSQERYISLGQWARYSGEVHVISQGAYAPWKMQVRNHFLVDHADFMLVLWDGSAGGTGNCMEYVERMKRPYENLWQAWYNFRK